MSLDRARTIAHELNITGGRVEPKKRYPTLVRWVEDVWWPHARSYLKLSSQKRNRWTLDRQLLPALGAKPLDKINRAVILRWFEPYSRTSPGAANKALELLNTILKHAVKSEVMSRNPARRIQRNPRRKMTRFLSDEERKRLLAELDKVPAQYRTQVLVIKMLLYTGCRRNEILKLRFTEVRDGLINLTDSKTGARTVWLRPKALAVIEEAEAMQEASGKRSEFVFPHPHDPGRSLGKFTTFWRNLLIRAKIEDFRLHDLRHSFATDALRQGVPLPVLSKLMGHSSINMTRRYTHSTNTDVFAAAERIGNQLIAKLRWEG
jgi:integrase